MASIHGALPNPKIIPQVHIFEEESSMTAWETMFHRMITEEIPQVNGMSHRSWASEQMIVVRKPTLDVDLGVTFLNQARWTMFLGNYLESESFKEFLGYLPHMNRSQVWTYPIPENGKHNNGACLLSITYSASPPTITLVSRATIWSPMGLLDMRFGSCLANLLGAEFHWFTHQLQVSGMTSIPALINLGYWPIVKKQKNTICARIRYQYDRIKAKGEHSKFATRRRYFKKIARAEALPKIKGQGSRRKWPGYFPELPSYLIPEGLEDWIDERKV